MASFHRQPGRESKAASKFTSSTATSRPQSASSRAEPLPVSVPLCPRATGPDAGFSLDRTAIRGASEGCAGRVRPAFSGGCIVFSLTCLLFVLEAKYQTPRRRRSPVSPGALPFLRLREQERGPLDPLLRADTHCPSPSTLEAQLFGVRGALGLC